MKLDEAVCPVCTSRDTALFFSQHAVPIQCGYLARSRLEALQAPLGDIDLHHCRTCGHVWNDSFDPNSIGFDPNYDFSQYHSPAYRAYVKSAIERLKSRYDLAGKTALDIACGKGDFMRMLISAGFERAIGFDPTFVDGALTPDESLRITVHRKYYDQSERALRPHLVTCRSALQYVPRPRDLLNSVKEALQDSPGTIVCFEVPNGAEPLRERVVWFVMYEAGCFFTAPSLARLFRECGFQVLDVLPALNGSHLEIEARPATAPRPHAAESEDHLKQIACDVTQFAAEFARQAAYWEEKFRRYAAAGRNVLLWGAGMRAISLLVNVPHACANVRFVVDVNPHRQGRFLPKTGQETIGPERLATIRPDVVVATNPNYADEIHQQLRALGVECEFEVLR